MSREVYVGHVPFNMAEEQIEDIFKSAGPVQQTRLVFDATTGKSKGYAFVQYFEPESAASAVRNLDGHKVGNMTLRVNYSSGKFPGTNNNNNSHNNPSSGASGGFGRNRGGSGAPTPAEEATVVGDIVNTVSTYSLPQKLDMLNELKAMAAADRAELQTLLTENPQLAYAVIQSMFELGKLDPAASGSLILDTPPAAQRRQGTPSRKPPQQQSQSQPQQQQLQQQLPPQQRRRPPNVGPSAPPEQLQMYQQLMSLTTEQLNAMPPEQRQAALGLRSQMAAMMQ